MSKTLEKLEQIMTTSPTTNGHIMVNFEDMNWIASQIINSNELEDAFNYTEIKNEFIPVPINIGELLGAIVTDDTNAVENMNTDDIFQMVQAQMEQAGYELDGVNNMSMNSESNNTVTGNGFVVQSKHGTIKAEISSNGGIWLSINDVKLVLVEFDEEREAHVIRAYNQDMQHDDYEYIQEIKTMGKKLNDKLDDLIERKKEELGILIIDVAFNTDKHAHILAKRKSDDSFIVWSSPNTGEFKTTYVDFYNGAYDLDLNSAVTELNRRVAT